jgi:hypothetical protein
MQPRLIHRPIPPVLLLPLLVGGFYLAYRHQPLWEATVMSTLLGFVFWLNILLGEWCFTRLAGYAQQRVHHYRERCAQPPMKQPSATADARNSFQ